MKKLKYVIPWSLVLIMMIMIFCFSSQKSGNSLQTSNIFADVLARTLHSDFDILSDTIKTDILSDCQFVVRKTAHFSIYAVLGVLCLIACKISKFKYCQIISALICLLYAISDEIHQYFVEGRSCELRDVMIDFLGAVCGIIVFTIIFNIIKYFKNRKA